MPTIGELLHTRRRELGMRQDEAAVALGTHQATLCKWERDMSLPARRKLPVIAAFLDLNVDAVAAVRGPGRGKAKPSADDKVGDMLRHVFDDLGSLHKEVAELKALIVDTRGADHPRQSRPLSPRQRQRGAA